MTAGGAVPRIAMFDLDGTLLPIDSDHAFGDFLVRLGWVDALEHRRRNDAFYADYLAGRLDVHAYVEFASAAWRGRPAAEVARARAQFQREVIEPAIRPAALALVEKHRAAGDLLAIVTSTDAYITGPIARAFGIDHLLATELECDAGGRCSGRIAGTPCLREGKVLRVQQWLATRGTTLADVPQSWYYGDSMNDLPLLEAVSHPVAANPAPALERLAAERGWPVLQLFGNP